MTEVQEEEEVVVAPKQYKTIFATYGTLRKDQGNYNWILRGASDYLGTIQTEPIFTMYSLGGFPAVAEGGDTAITVDLFGVDDDEIIADVNSLEGYTGIRNNPSNWYNTISIETPFGDAEMFIMNDQRIKSQRIVTNGDWINRTLSA